MSLLSNANITRYGVISSWNSNWVESNILYTSIVYTDIYVNELINGIYYKLKMPSSLPIVKNIGYKKTLIFVSSFIINKENRFYKWRNYYRGLFYVKYLRRRILFSINRICNYILYYNNNVNYDINLFIKAKSNINNTYINYIKKKDKIIISSKNKYIVIKYYKKFNKSLYKNVKIKISRSKINMSSYKKKKINKMKLYKRIIKKNIEKKNKQNNKFNLCTSSITINKKNNNYINKKNYLINKRKLLQVIKNKQKKYNIFIKKFTFNNIFKRIKNKIKNKYISSVNNLEIKHNNINYIICYLLMCKVVLVYIYILLYILLNNIYNINIITKKYILVKCLLNNVNKIKKIYNITIKTSFIFNNKFIPRINKINIFKNNKKYGRVRSQYRLNKKIEKLKKEKKYNMFRRVILYQHYLDYVCDTPKYITRVNKELIYKQLCLKINDTINQYLDNNIYFIHNYNDDYFNRIDNPKLLSDFIKIFMKYEEKNPNILKKIVKIHSKQNDKSKVFARKYIRKSHIFVKKINKKLKLYNKVLNIYYKRKKNVQQIEIQSTLKNNKYIKNKISNDITYKYKNYNKKYNYLYSRSNKIKINKINNIKTINIHKTNNKYILYNKLIYCRYLTKWLLNMKLLKYKKYPLIGIRIELSGPTKKGRRTQTHLYNEWVDFYTLPGKMQLVKIINDIKYWQSYGLTQRASIGIKVWMHFHTIRYSELRKNIIE